MIEGTVERVWIMMAGLRLIPLSYLNAESHLVSFEEWEVLADAREVGDLLPGKRRLDDHHPCRLVLLPAVKRPCSGLWRPTLLNNLENVSVILNLTESHPMRTRTIQKEESAGPVCMGRSWDEHFTDTVMGSESLNNPYGLGMSIHPVKIPFNHKIFSRR